MAARRFVDAFPRDSSLRFASSTIIYQRRTLANTAGEEFGKFEWKYNISSVPRVTKLSGIIPRELRDRSASSDSCRSSLDSLSQNRPVYEQRNCVALNREWFPSTSFKTILLLRNVNNWEIKNQARRKIDSVNIDLVTLVVSERAMGIY